MRTRRARALSMTALCSLVILLDAAHVHTQTAPHPTVARFAGTYRNRVDDGGEAIIRTAIELGVASMAPVRRSLAHRHLLVSDPPIARLTITPEGEGLSIAYRHDRHNRTARLGTFADNRAVGGGAVQVKHEVVGQRLRETYRESRGGAVHEFVLSPDGRTLHFEATITSRHLPSAISYRLEFARR